MGRVEQMAAAGGGLQADLLDAAFEVLDVRDFEDFLRALRPVASSWLQAATAFRPVMELSCALRAVPPRLPEFVERCLGEPPSLHTPPHR